MKSEATGLLAAFVLACLSGCGAITFTEADHGQTREVFLGMTFRVSLPSAAVYRRPRLKGTIIRPLGEQHEDPPGTDVFEFGAEALGEDELRIPRSSGGDFVLHVRVKSASDEPTVSGHQP